MIFAKAKSIIEPKYVMILSFDVARVKFDLHRLDCACLLLAAWKSGVSSAQTRVICRTREPPSESFDSAFVHRAMHSTENEGGQRSRPPPLAPLGRFFLHLLFVASQFFFVPFCASSWPWGFRGFQLSTFCFQLCRTIVFPGNVRLDAPSAIMPA